MANDLVIFPKNEDAWEWVAGPGMYVLAALLHEEPEECGVGASITMLRPSGRLIAQAHSMWPIKESRDRDADLLEEAARLFERQGEPYKAAVMRAQFPAMDLSMDLSMATHMGSTRRTIRNRETGEFWCAGWDDLTPSGVLHLSQVHTCFNRLPLLLTFLGDEEER